MTRPAELSHLAAERRKKRAELARTQTSHRNRVQAWLALERATRELIAAELAAQRKASRRRPVQDATPSLFGSL